MTVKWVLALAASGLLQASDAELHRAFLGKEVTLRIDMPGTQHGVDLHLDRDDPMDWKQYSQRIKNFGVSIPKGRTARVTSLVVKKDVIEMQFDGGGFGTFGDDTSTTVSTYVPKSSRETSLERARNRETDPGKRRRLDMELRHEQDLRHREEMRLRAISEPANAMKRQEVMEKRLRGGSRFNLRNLSTTADVTSNQVKDWLKDFVDFGGPPPVISQQQKKQSQGAALRRGMPMDEVLETLGEGKLLSEAVGADGILTQQWEFVKGERTYSVTVVEGLLVRYTMKAR